MRVPMPLLMPVLLPLLLGTSMAHAASYKEGDVVKVIANNVRATGVGHGCECARGRTRSGGHGGCSPAVPGAPCRARAPLHE
jgi:hypothetical protein